MDKKPRELLARTRAFSLRIIRLFSELSRSTTEQVIGRQMLRSGTSVGAHIHEAKRSRSDAEMISKVQGALQELEETIYWLLLLEEARILNPSRLQFIKQEADELVAILVTSVIRLKSRKPYKPARTKP
jgi:four helix bundle protein